VSISYKRGGVVVLAVMGLILGRRRGGEEGWKREKVAGASWTMGD
jgi:hypothetical protein